MNKYRKVRKASKQREMGEQESKNFAATQLAASRESGD